MPPLSRTLKHWPAVNYTFKDLPALFIIKAVAKIPELARRTAVFKMKTELVLSSEQVQEFQKVGAICLRNVFDTAWVDKVIRGIDKVLDNPSQYGERLTDDGDGTTAAYFNDYCNWRRIEEFQDYVYNSPAAAIAGQLTKSTHSSFYHEHVLVKEPGSSKKTPWHVDQSYYPVDGFQVCSIWMPVDPIGLESTIQFVSGSHLWPQWFIPRKFATTWNYEICQPLGTSKQYMTVPSDEEIEGSNEIVQWEVSPGDCIVFHMKTLHGAPGNLSKTTRRRILSTRWFGDDAVIASRPWQISPPILGGLKVGDKAVSDEFPTIWTAA